MSTNALCQAIYIPCDIGLVGRWPAQGRRASETVVLGVGVFVGNVPPTQHASKALALLKLVASSDEASQTLKMREVALEVISPGPLTALPYRA
jgi:hypothetical protein